MAQHHLCDGGCGFSSPNPADFEEHGLVIKREYCPECSEHVKAYLQARDDAHTEAAQLFLNKHTDAKLPLIEKGMKLPDHHG